MFWSEALKKYKIAINCPKATNGQWISTEVVRIQNHPTDTPRPLTCEVLGSTKGCRLSANWGIEAFWERSSPTLFLFSSSSALFCLFLFVWHVTYEKKGKTFFLRPKKQVDCSCYCFKVLDKPPVNLFYTKKAEVLIHL